jgi:hypothetical protein
MTPTCDPTQIDHPVLREFAVQAVWVAKLEEAVGVLEELIVGIVEEGRPPDKEPWDEDPLGWRYRRCKRTSKQLIKNWKHE